LRFGDTPREPDKACDLALGEAGKWVVGLPPVKNLNQNHKTIGAF
jgi:hypothetical protein